MPFKLDMTGSSKKTKRAWAAEPKELTTKRSRDRPFNRFLEALKSFSLKIVARAGKNREPTKMAAYLGLTYMQTTLVA